MYNINAPTDLNGLELFDPAKTVAPDTIRITPGDTTKRSQEFQRMCSPIYIIEEAPFHYLKRNST